MSSKEQATLPIDSLLTQAGEVSADLDDVNVRAQLGVATARDLCSGYIADRRFRSV